jgi:hypothetical protein
MADIKPPLVGVAEHPRAALSIRRWKAWASLAGFLAAGYGSWVHGLPIADSGLRALAGAAAGYLIGGIAVVTVWRHLLQVEARLAIERIRQHQQREAARREAEEP